MLKSVCHVSGVYVPIKVYFTIQTVQSFSLIFTLTPLELKSMSFQLVDVVVVVVIAAATAAAAADAIIVSRQSNLLGRVSSSMRSSHTGRI